MKPRVIVALGATAAQALLGKQFRVTQDRGKPIPSDLAEAVVATVHPSSVLRAPDDAREEARRDFVADLKAVAAYLEHASPHRLTAPVLDPRCTRMTLTPGWRAW